MLEKKIKEKLSQLELDPMDNDLFGKIMTERSKRNGKSNLIFYSGLVLMMGIISIVGITKYWGNMPKDGYTLSQFAAIELEREAENKKTNALTSISELSSNNKEALSSNKTQTDQQTTTTLTAISATNTSKTLSTLKNRKTPENNSRKQEISFRNINVLNKKKQSNLYSQKTSEEKPNIGQSKPAVITFSEKEIAEKIKNSTLLTLSASKLKPIANDFNVSGKINSNVLPAIPNEGREIKEDQENTDAKNTWKFLPRDVDIYYGIYSNQRFINANNDNLAQTLEKYEHITQTNTFGMSANYHLKKNIFANFGFQLTAIQSRIDPKNNLTVRHWKEEVIDPGGQNQIINHSDTTSIAGLSGKNSATYIEIPLQLGMRWQLKKRHIIQPEFGIISSFYHKSNGLIYNNDGIAENFNGKLSRVNSVYFDAVTGVSYTYLLGRLGLFIHPNLRYSLTNQARISVNFNQYNSMIGINFGAKYILR